MLIIVPPHKHDPTQHHLWAVINDNCNACHLLGRGGAAAIRPSSGGRPFRQGAGSPQPAMGPNRGTVHVQSQNADCVSERRVEGQASLQVLTTLLDAMPINDAVLPAKSSNGPVFGPKRLEMHCQADLAAAIHFCCKRCILFSTHAS